jgi:hypothetical protein
MLGMPPKYYGAATPTTGKPGLSGGGGLDLKKILLIGGLGVFVIIILIIGVTFVGSLTKGPQDDFLALAARTNNLQALFEAEKTDVTNGELKVINAQASTLLMSSSFDLGDQAKAQFGVSEIPDAITSAQSVADAKDALAKAKVAGTFDRTYVTQMTDKINSVIDMAKRLKSALDSNAARTAIDKLLASLNAINDELSNVQL